MFSIENLRVFQDDELKVLLCGDQFPQWTHDDILAYTEPRLGFTKSRFVSILLLAKNLRLFFHFLAETSYGIVRF